MLKYKIGDFIVYGDDICPERGRIQKVINNSNFTNWCDEPRVQIETVFLDNGNKNVFTMGSSYCDKCDIINDLEYGNGVPMLWEDVV